LRNATRGFLLNAMARLPWQPFDPINLKYPMKKYLLTLLVTSLLALGATNTSAADTAPKSVIHVVTVAWKEGTTPAQSKPRSTARRPFPPLIPASRMSGPRHQGAESPGTTLNRTHVIVMEFADEAASRPTPTARRKRNGTSSI